MIEGSLITFGIMVAYVPSRLLICISKRLLIYALRSYVSLRALTPSLSISITIVDCHVLTPLVDRLRVVSHLAEDIDRDLTCFDHLLASRFWASGSSAQWRVPVALQIIFALIMIIAIWFVSQPSISNVPRSDC